jgi:hypothetical protein
MFQPPAGARKSSKKHVHRKRIEDIPGQGNHNGKPLLHRLVRYRQDILRLARLGGIPIIRYLPPSRICTSPTLVSSDLPKAKLLYASDLESLCSTDEKGSQKALFTHPASSPLAISLLPDFHTISWYHARENFIGTKLDGKTAKSQRGLDPWPTRPACLVLLDAQVVYLQQRIQRRIQQRQHPAHSAPCSRGRGCST